MKIQDLLRLGVKDRASDLHIFPGLPPLLRIDGDLVAIKDMAPLNAEATKSLIYSVMLPEQQKLFETHLVIDMAVSFHDIGNFRVSVLHQLHGVAAVFRVVPEKVPSIDELAVPMIFRKLLLKPHGLILIAGATGSGKTTTLAVMIDYINSMRASHIITIEDPIEFTHTNKKSAITQLQVGRDTPDFATALRASLRQDPDVIMIGEIRDLATTRLAMTAAETGHLVLASLHASSAPMVVSRIIDMFPGEERARARNMLSEVLQAATCQALVKKINGGRIAAFEIMIATPAIRHMITQDTTAAHMESAIQTGGEAGMCTMDQHLQELVVKHLITFNTARSISTVREAIDAPQTKK